MCSSPKLAQLGYLTFFISLVHLFPVECLDIQCSNDLCHDAQWSDKSLGVMNVDRPPLKDTVLVPVGGYVVVRFYTDNPGYWMGHCHQTEHLHEGMYV